MAGNTGALPGLRIRGLKTQHNSKIVKVEIKLTYSGNNLYFFSFGIYQNIFMLLFGGSKKMSCWHVSRRKSYKTTSEESALHQYSNRKVLHKWRKLKSFVTLPTSGRPTEISPRAKCVITCKVTKKHIVYIQEAQGLSHRMFMWPQ